MNTQHYIINDVEPFPVSASIKAIQETFNQLTYSHLIIEKDGAFLGCLSETDAHCFESGKTVSEHQYALEPFCVRKETHWLDILEAFALHNSNIMPVLDDKEKYLGYYELNDIMHCFNDTPFLSEAGGIIVVEKGTKDYSFSEISQIVETNDAKIYGTFISKSDSNTVQITLKIGHQGMNSIVQTFRRYGYTVVSNHEEDKFMEDLKERSDYLDKYLNI